MSTDLVVIVGAGPAGLTAAHACAERGLPARVLEAGSRVGGIARTEVHRGYRFDIGGHRFFTKSPAVMALWRDVLGSELMLRPRLSRIYYRNRFFYYPLRPRNALSGLGLLETAHVLLSYARARVMPPPEGDSFEHWVSRRFGRKLYRVFFKTYTEKVWGVPATEIRAEWAAQRIRNLDLPKALRDAVFGKRSEDSAAVTSLIEEFHYPRLGPGQMWERLAARVTDAGVPVELDATVTRIEHEDGSVRSVRWRDVSGEERAAAVAGVLSSMPLAELLRSLDPLPPDAVLAAAAGLRHRDLLTVNVILRNPDVFPDTWIYVHSPNVRLGRIQNFKNWSPDLVPDPATTSLGLEYFCFDTDPIWSLPDEKLLQLGMRELEQLGLARVEELIDGFVVRQRKSYPLYDASYGENIRTIAAWLGGFDNLFTVGRNGLHRYNNQDHSMVTALLAVRNLAGERHDLWAVNTEPDYHEEVTPDVSSVAG